VPRRRPDAARHPRLDPHAVDLALLRSMRPRTSRTTACMLGAFAALHLAGTAQAQVPPTYPSPVSKPNVVLIVLDDLGFEDLASVPTPTLDLFGPFGRRYERCYVAPDSSPTRTMLQTGLHGHRDFVGSSLDASSNDEIGLAPARTTLA